MRPSSHAERVFVSIAKNRHLNAFALCALRKATELLGYAIGLRLAELRDSGEPLQICFSRVEENALHARLYHEAADISAERWQKLPERRRPHYAPEQRFRILRFQHLLVLSDRETARLFSVSPNTIVRWREATRTEPNSETVGSLVRPQPPVRRYADVVRHLIQTMALMGFGGNRLIAQTLARAGWKLSLETVRRIRREVLPQPAPTSRTSPGRAVRARYPNHVWLADLTDVPGLFRFFHFKIAVVLDAFSRMPLAARVFPAEPSSPDIQKLFRATCRRFGPPRHFVSDQGSQFIDSRFRELLACLQVRHRFGAIGNVGSIALIERLWKTLKNNLSLRSFKPLFQQDLERRLYFGLLYYAYIKPHQGLGGATPAELFFGLPPAHLQAVAPPRARPREGPFDVPFDIRFLDPESRLPILVRKAA